MKSRGSKLVLGALAAAQISAMAGAPAARAAEPVNHPHIDLAFCIDTTGSMGSEIENVKTKMKEIVARLAGGKPSPVIRVGLVAYRDRGDEYVTKTFSFSQDIDKVVKDISSLRADGGGDAPESVNEGLHVAVNDLKWDDNKKTLKMLFLIGDAGPHVYAGDYDWKEESKKAISHGIMINTIGCQGLEQFPVDQGVGVFKEIARLTDGKYESLSYRHDVVAADGRRETLVSSGGRLFKMKASSADWRLGADTLTARGAAEKVIGGPAPAGYAAASAAPACAPAAPVAMAKTFTARSRSMMKDSRGVFDAVSGSREENNLSDLVLNATKQAAAKKLNLDFKEK